MGKKKNVKKNAYDRIWEKASGLYLSHRKLMDILFVALLFVILFFVRVNNINVRTVGSKTFKIQIFFRSSSLFIQGILKNAICIVDDNLVYPQIAYKDFVSLKNDLVDMGNKCIFHIFQLQVAD